MSSVIHTHSPRDQEDARRVVTIASAPAGHPYIARISASADVVVLPDPRVPGAPAGAWWPPAVLNTAWIEANRSAAQLLHIHFGTESFSPGHLTAVIEAAHAAGWPVVFTAHDLENPQLDDQRPYIRQLDELMNGADALITLTRGAAAAIHDRWGRQASVIPHPSVRDRNAGATPTRPSADVRVGVHLKDLRPNVDGPSAVRAVLASLARLRADGIPAVAEIRMQHRVRDEAAREQVRRLCEADDHAEFIEHDRLSDSDLEAALSGLDVCVLPYRHGTHSGWLELCWDLGVSVAAPGVGFYAEQHPDGSVATFAAGDHVHLAQALASLLRQPGFGRAGSPERVATVAARLRVRRVADAAAADAHSALYRHLLATWAA
ncbi:MAG: glycosyltransferase [Microbacterium sp.]